MRHHNRMRLESFSRGLVIFSSALTTLIFVLILGLLIGGAVSRRPPKIGERTVLTFEPVGTLVDSYSRPSEYQGIPLGPPANEILLDEMIQALDAASLDERVLGAYFNLDSFWGGGAGAIGELAEAMLRFREGGKPLIVDADSYDTAAYRLAAAGSHVVVDRLGQVFPTGYGSWRTYLAEGLEKLGAEANLFRTGPSKSAGETYVRDSMSQEAQADSRRLLTDLWEDWLQGVAASRGVDENVLSEWINEYDRYLVEARGDGSASALKAGLVDAVETGGVTQSLLDETFGDSKGVDWQEYLRTVKSPSWKLPTVAVVKVSGALVYGPGSTGNAGSDDVVEALQAVADDPMVRALVLRIDSPGGDVRAGEAIRRSLEELRESQGLPVVASMGSLAASGGYWIALESDYILARRETITGSIGVFSLSLTFEKALREWLGMRIDGLGTTPWSGASHPGRSLDARMASLYESSVQDIDSMFRSLVAQKRGLDDEAVLAAAGGVPWSGKRALDLGLVDELGGLEAAREKAAELAGLSQWRTADYQGMEDQRAQMISRMFWGNIDASGSHQNSWNWISLLLGWWRK